MEKVKILCVEDNPGDARIIKELLGDDTPGNYEITFVDKLEKVENVTNDPVYDAILLDLNLPGSSGLDTLERIQVLVPDTPIIVLTGLQDEKISEKTIKSGVQDYLNKNNITKDLLTHSLQYAIDRHAFSRKMEENRQRFQTLIEKNFDGVIVINGEGIIKYLNPSCEKLFSRTKDEMLGQSFGFPISVNEYTEISLLGKGGVITTVEMRITEITWEDEPCYLAALRDISERKQVEDELAKIYEELKQANLDKDKFFTIIAHDLRSPLCGFIGLTELIMNNCKTLPQAKLTIICKKIYDTANNIYQFLGNLLEWAKMQKGLINFEPQELNLPAIVLQNISLINERALQKEITIVSEVPDNQKFYADEQMIDTILRNLISNAVKFTNRDGTVTIKSKKVENGMIEISVSDTGVGISENNIKKLFIIGEKIGSKGTDDEPSSGLGLILCKEFVERHGGRIWVESGPGKGTVFYFTIPLNAGPKEKTAIGDLVGYGEDDGSI